jgi:phosphohistidine phosphatase
MRVSGPEGGAAAGAPRSKLLVWGHPAADYHNHLYQRAKSAAHRAGGLRCEVLGGGRIEHDAGRRVISVYGYSAAFGPAPHEVAAALLRRWHPFYGPEAVSVSYDGY